MFDWAQKPDVQSHAPDSGPRFCGFSYSSNSTRIVVFKIVAMGVCKFEGPAPTPPRCVHLRAKHLAFHTIYLDDIVIPRCASRIVGDVTNHPTYLLDSLHIAEERFTIIPRCRLRSSLHCKVSTPVLFVEAKLLVVI
jgi:hypothetical protein